MIMWFFEEVTDELISSADRTFDFSSVVPHPFTLARAGTTALGRDNSGRWVPFTQNAPRSWYHPITLDGPYTLIEPERTQILYRTRQPTPTTVQSTSSMVVSEQTPFGTGCVMLVPNSTNTTHGWNLFFGTAAHGAAVADNTTLALCVVIRPSGLYNNITFSLLNRTGVYSTVRVNLQGNGSVVSASGVVEAAVKRDTDDFFQIEIVNNFGIGTTTPAFNAGFHNQDGNQTFVGDGTSGFYLAYIGAEIGSEVTSPIINPGLSQVIRPADFLTATTEWIESGPNTFGLTYVPLSSRTGTILNIAGSDRIDLKNNGSSVLFSTLANPDAGVSITAPSPAPGVERHVVVTISSGNSLVAQNGILVGSDNGGLRTPSNFSSLRIGDAVAGNSPEPMLLKLIKYWSEALGQDAAISYSQDLTQNIEITGQMTITTQPTMTIVSSSSTVSLLVTLIGLPIGTSISYSTADDTAVSGVDYIGVGGNLVIPPGETSGVIEVGLMPRNEIEDKTFKIILNSASGAKIDNGICVVLLLRKMPENAQTSTKIVFGSSLPAEMSLSRPSPAWTRNSAGVWTQVAAGAYREHFVASGASGLLIEPELAEQHLFDSVDPGFTATGGTRDIVTSEVTPTGARQIQFRETTANSQHKLSLTLGGANSVPPTGTFTLSILIRALTRRYFSLSVRGIDNILQNTLIDLNGDGIATAGTQILTTVERDAFRPHWYTVTLSQPQSLNAGVAMIIELLSALQDGQTSFAGTSGAGFDLCHVQIETGSGASSPIIVSGASAKTSRAADVLKASGVWHQRQSYSLGVRFRRLRDYPEAQRLWMAKDVANQINGVVLKNGVISYDIVGDRPRVRVEVVSTGNQTVWTLPDSGTDGAPYVLIVSVDGLFQAPTSYSLTGNNLNFTEAPPVGALVDVRGLPIATVLLENTGTGSGTVWILPATVVGGAGSLIVAVDGLVQPASSYSVFGNQIIFTQPPPLGAILCVTSLGKDTLSQEFVLSSATTQITFATQSSLGAEGVIVVIDGLVQAVSSYALSGISITFSEAVPVGALVDVRFL